jgi:hypothetical protein
MPGSTSRQGQVEQHERPPLTRVPGPERKRRADDVRSDDVAGRSGARQDEIGGRYEAGQVRHRRGPAAVLSGEALGARPGSVGDNQLACARPCGTSRGEAAHRASPDDEHVEAG